MNTARKTRQGASRSLTVRILVWGAVCPFVLAAVFPSTASGFGSWSQETDPTGYTHFLNNPNDFPSWDLTNITWKFDASFGATWPNPGVKTQIREAFKQWDTANGTANGGTYSYNRANGWQNFGDIRSVAVHEIGHVLGIRHPNQAAGVNRNWRPNGGGSYVQQADNNNEVMRSWINPGDYNHVLSHDELDAFDRMYGQDLNFTEVGGGSSANIVIKSYTAGVNNWAVGGWSGNWRSGDHSQGIRITSGEISFNDSSGQPLGFKTLGINWDYQNTGGKPTRSFKVRTTGTNNRTPLFHFDNQWPIAGNKFTTFSTAAGGSNAKDDITHTWSNPTSGDIPDSELLHVGLEQDVWDWTVDWARVRHPDGTETNAPLLSFHDWSHTIVVGTPAAAGADWELTTSGIVRVMARGIRLAAPDVATHVGNVALAPVGDMNLMLEDLNRDLVTELQRGKALIPIPELSKLHLDPHEDWIIVLSGNENDLPPDVLKKGNFLILNRPDLLEGELFAMAQSMTEEAEVATFALMGVPPNARVPEPATLCLLAMGGIALIRRRRSTRCTS